MLGSLLSFRRVRSSPIEFGLILTSQKNRFRSGLNQDRTKLCRNSNCSTFISDLDLESSWIGLNWIRVNITLKKKNQIELDRTRSFVFLPPLLHANPIIFIYLFIHEAIMEIILCCVVIRSTATCITYHTVIKIVN